MDELRYSFFQMANRVLHVPDPLPMLRHERAVENIVQYGKRIVICQKNP